MCGSDRRSSARAPTAEPGFRLAGGAGAAKTSGMTAAPLTLTLSDADATAALAARIAPDLRAGDVVLLEGPIGAGKTHFARSLIQARLAAAGQAEDVPSPTYTLVQTYEAGGAEIWHADLYRLSDPSEAEELGLAQAFADAIVLVEWPDRLGPLRPAGALHLSLTPDGAGDGRLARLTGGGPRWAALLDRLADAHV